MIKSFQHKGLERFFKTGETRGIQPHHAPRIRRLLDALDQAADVAELNVPSWFLHRFKGDRKNLWSLRVSGNWRITFVFEGGDAGTVNLEDYH